MFKLCCDVSYNLMLSSMLCVTSPHRTHELVCFWFSLNERNENINRLVKYSDLLP